MASSSFALPVEGDPCVALAAPQSGSATGNDPYLVALSTFTEDPQNWKEIPLSSAAIVAYAVSQGVSVSEKVISKAIKKTKRVAEIPSEPQLRRKIRKAFETLHGVGFFKYLGRWFVSSESELAAVQLQKKIEDDLVTTLAAQGRLRDSTPWENFRFHYWTNAPNTRSITWAALFAIPSLLQGYPPPYLPEINVLEKNPPHAAKIQTAIRLFAAVYLGFMIGTSVSRVQDQIEEFQKQMETIQIQQMQQQRQHQEEMDRIRERLRLELERQLRTHTQAPIPPSETNSQ